LRGQPDLLAFIVDGSTTRSTAIERLGEPGRRLRAGAICTWRLRHDDAGQFIAHGWEAATWQDVDASLVMVFDEHGVLHRHTVIKVHKP
jgi:hypothetical protein